MVTKSRFCLRQAGALDRETCSPHRSDIVVRVSPRSPVHRKERQIFSGGNGGILRVSAPGKQGEFTRNGRRLGSMPLIYSFVARGTTVLADFSTFTGNFSVVAIQARLIVRRGAPARRSS